MTTYYVVLRLAVDPPRSVPVYVTTDEKKALQYKDIALSRFIDEINQKRQDAFNRGEACNRLLREAEVSHWASDFYVEEVQGT